jgi:hypothetical protein
MHGENCTMHTSTPQYTDCVLYYNSFYLLLKQFYISQNHEFLKD